MRLNSTSIHTATPGESDARHQRKISSTCQGTPGGFCVPLRFSLPDARTGPLSLAYRSNAGGLPSAPTSLGQLTRRARYFLFLLTVALVALGNFSANAQNALHATGGTGLYKDRIWWLNFSGINVPVGGTLSRDYTIGNATVHVTITNTGTQAVDGYQPGVWSGDGLDDLYNIGGTGGSNTLVNALSNTTIVSSAKYNVSVYLTTPSGQARDLSLIFSNAESDNTGQVAPVEYEKSTTNGSPWQLLEGSFTASDGFQQVTFSNNNLTAQVTAGARASGGEQGNNILLYTTKTATTLASPLSVDVELFSDRGGVAQAIGLIIDDDFSDDPATYGTPVHMFQPLLSGGNPSATSGTFTNYLSSTGTLGGTPVITNGTLTDPTNLKMGFVAGDNEVAAFPGSSATGDDVSGVDDEDGVGFFATLAAGATTYSVNITASNTTGSTANLCGWIDFNKNGTFEAGEGACTTVPTGTTNGTFTLNWSGLSGITAGTSYARFRITTDVLTTSSPTDAVFTGEVEDYSFIIGGAQAPICGQAGQTSLFSTNFGSTFAPTVATVIPGATTSLSYTNNGCPPGGFYFIGVQSLNCSNRVNVFDHTTGNGTGDYMILSTSNSGVGANLLTFPVSNLCSSGTFTFGAWLAPITLASATGCTNSPNVTFGVYDATGTTLLGSYTTGNITRTNTLTWGYYGFSVTVPTGTTSVVIKILNNTTTGCGSEFALDDITFTLCGPSVNATAASSTVCSGSSASLTATVQTGVFATPVYQWQQSTDGGTTWTNVSGATSATLTTPSVTTAIQYRVLVAGDAAGLTSSACRVVSNAVALTAVTCNANLAITKTGTTTVASGGTVSYSLVITNAGPQAADGSTVSDPAVANFTATGVSCAGTSGGAVCPTTPSVATLQAGTLAIPTLPSGGSLTLVVTGAAGSSGTITNIASVTTPAGVTDSNPANNSSTAVTPITPAADLAIVKTGTTTTVANGAASYTLVVTNNGPLAANGATVKDAAVANFTASTVTCSGASGGAVCPTTPTVATLQAGTLAIPTLPSGGSITLVISGVAGSTTGTITNLASVSAPAGITDTNPANNSSTAVTAVGTPIADLAVIKSGPATATPSGAVSYTILVLNNGPSAANGATVSDPAIANFVATGISCAGSTGGAVCPAVSVATLQNGTLSIPTLPSGSSVSFVLTGTAGSAGSIVNTVTVSPPAGTTDTNPTNNSSTVTTVLCAATAGGTVPTLKSN